MIYFFYGTDVDKVRTKAFEWVAKARAKEPNLVYVRLTREEITNATLEEVAHSGGLFVSRLLVLLDDPFPAVRVATEEGDEGEVVANSIVEEYLDTLVDSDNAIVVLAPKLSLVKAKKISAKAKVEYKFDKAASREVSRGFNSGLVDALGARSREKLWLEIQRALQAGDAPEKLHGLLHWKARDLMAKDGRYWKGGEARKVSLDLIALLQESRRGGLELSLALERFALAM